MNDDQFIGDAERIRQTRDKADEILRDIESPDTNGDSQELDEAKRDDQYHGQRDAEKTKVGAINSNDRRGKRNILGIGFFLMLIPLGALSLFALNQIASQSYEAGRSTSSVPDAPEEEPTRWREEPNRTVRDKSQNSAPQERPAQCGEWGCADVYKFGRVPDDVYPHSCAFSRTDSRGMTIISRSPSQIEYWACRDQGGDQSDGYSVSWADGKETKYTFGSGGRGTIVGTDGRGYPMRWKNSRHKGTQIIVINHEDGAESWIPGRVNY